MKDFQDQQNEFDAIQRNLDEQAEFEAEFAAEAEAASFQTEQLAPPKDLELTQVGLAHAFARVNRAKLRSVPEMASHNGTYWLYWSGMHWEHDNRGLVQGQLKIWLFGFYRKAQEAMALVREEAEQRFPEKEQRAERQDFIKNSDPAESMRAIKQAQTKGNLTAILGLAALDEQVVVPVTALDNKPEKLSTATGTVNLRTGEVTPSNPDDLITKAAVTGYAPGARAPRWEQFLLEVTQDDPELIEYMQRMAGYFLTGHVGEHKLFLLHGSGRNGKDVFAETLSFVLGDMAGYGASSLLIQSKHKEHPTEIADLKGKRLVVHSEIEDGSKLLQAQVKWLTGSENLKGRFMRQDFIEFQNTAKHMMLTNFLPDVRGEDIAMADRLVVIPLTRYFTEEERDTHLLEKLQDERAGILAWMVQGAMRWASEGLQRTPLIVSATTRTYLAEHDPGGQFVNECLEVTGSPRDWMSNAEMNLIAAWWVVEQVDGSDERHWMEKKVESTRKPKLIREGAKLTGPRGIEDDARFSAKTARGWEGVKPAKEYADLQPMALLAKQGGNF